MTTLTIRTESREEFVDITAQVQAAVREAAVREGVCFVWALHTTCGITVHARADPDVGRDLAARLALLAPRDADYRHDDGNADAHVKTALVGTSASLPVADGALLLGTWQGVFLAEFDGPRARRVAVRVLAIDGAR
ncbi:MAG: secondary thiamine-phosphate synthase enzyme YjbQ [Gemmatimonadota bacterium]